jgi:aspartyl-tRNA(Asn)/glutamyl-tRNA(Gln) amidotransferase subunit C
MITKDQLKHLSKLSKIDLTENEFETYTKQIEKIIKYLDKLDEISFEENNPSLLLLLSFKKLSELREDTIIEPTLNIDKIAKNLKDKFVRGPVMS